MFSYNTHYPPAVVTFTREPMHSNTVNYRAASCHLGISLAI